MIADLFRVSPGGGMPCRNPFSTSLEECGHQHRGNSQAILGVKGKQTKIDANGSLRLRLSFSLTFKLEV